jgi:hypothetical protein
MNYELIKLEEKAFSQFSAMQTATDDKISIPKIYYDMTGDHSAAAILDEILFWTLPKKKTGKTSLRVRKEGILWLAVSRSEWWERKRLTERQADRGIDKLEELGLIEKSIHRFNGHAQMHLRVIAKNFFSLYGKTLYENYLKEGEDADGNELHDIGDLYAMMGISDSPNGELPNGDTESPNGDSDSPNGDTNNSLHTKPPHKPSDKKQDFPSRKNPLGEKASLDWLVAAGVGKEEIGRLHDREVSEKKVTDHFEKVMGYNPLDWYKNKDLEALRRFLVTKTLEEIDTFAAWCKRDFSSLSPAKVRQYPRMAIDLWPQAVVRPEDDPDYDPRMNNTIESLGL